MPDRRDKVARALLHLLAIADLGEGAPSSSLPTPDEAWAGAEEDERTMVGLLADAAIGLFDALRGG